MTAVAVPSTTSDLGFLRRHWRLGAVVLVGIAPFVPSILSMRDFLLADNALGFTPFALVLAAALFWIRSHSHHAPSTRDLFTDAFVMAPLVVITFFILYVTPGKLSWYFWLNRVDLAALAPWATATALVFLGYQQVLRTWPTWVMLVFVWPYPAVSVQRQVSDTFLSTTITVAEFAVRFLRLPYDRDPADAQIFTSTHLPEGQNFTFIVADVCSGTAVTIGFLVVGAGIAFMSRGRAAARTKWLLTGLVLAFVSNLVRVVVLLTVATSASREVAVEQVHPILGLVLFALVTVVMLLLLRPFGLRFDPLPRGDRLAWEPAKGGGRAPVALSALMAIGAVAVGVSVVQAQELNFIGIGEGAPTVAIDSPRGVLPQIQGWELTHQTEITWTDLFGRTSRGDVFAYRAPGYQEGDPAVGVQTVVTEDRATLERYTLEQCIDFHGRDLEARQAVDLGHGVTGYLLHHVEEGVDSSILYFVIPVNVEDDIQHARIALFGDVLTSAYLDEADLEASTAASSPVTRLGQALETRMDGIADASAEGAYANLDRGLHALATAMVATMVETGGPGVGMEPSVDEVPAGS